MTRSRDIADQQKNLGGAVAPVAAGKNFVINGGFDIWQRGTTINSASHNTYTADQWININDSVGTINVTRQDVYSQGLGLKYGLRFEKSAGASNRFVLINLAEGALNCVGKQVTFSFWVRKGSALTSNVNVSIGTRAVKYGTVYDSGDFAVTNAQINSSTFTKFTSTFSITSATANASADLFEIEFSAIQAGGSNVYFEVAGVQLEIGSVATPFSRAGGTTQGELALCQRYYVRQEYNNANAIFYGTGSALSSTRSFQYVALPVSMRTAPSLAYGGVPALGDLVTNTSVTNLFFYACTTGNQQINIDARVASGLTQFRPYFLVLGGTGQFIEYSAEL